MEQIETADALQPSGHYSQAIVHNGIIYVSAQLPIDSITGEKKHGLINEEAERILENIDLILKASNSGKDQILKTTVFITDMSQWDQVNESYMRFFQNHKPARTIVAVKELHFGFQIAIEAIAKINNEFMY